MFALPIRLGGLGGGSSFLLPLRAAPQPASRLIAPPVPLPAPQYAPVGDSWGAVQIPAQPAPQIAGYSPIPSPGGTGILAPGDPALGYTLSFLYAYLVLDGNANAPWTAAYGQPLIKSPLSLFAHNPSEADFNVSYLPALYLWRDDQAGGKFSWMGTDWKIETSTWTMLWALPLGDQFRQAERSRYVNQFVKAVWSGIEVSITPGWVQPDDQVPTAAQYGSFLGQYTNMVRFKPLSWRRAQIRVPMANGAPRADYPAVEMKFEAVERLTPDLRRFAALQKLDQRISNPIAGSHLEHEIDN